MNKRNGVSLLVAFGATSLLVSSSASGFPTPIQTTRIATGFSRPVFVTAPPGDTSRLFVVEQRGSSGTASRADIRIINLPGNTINSSPFFSITGVGVNNEEGLLGFAFHPSFFAAPGNVNRGAFFVYYTLGGNNHVVRYTTLGQDPSANYDAASAQTVIDFSHPTNTNHNGGWIAFGPDGFLYIDTGDGGGSCDSPGNAQNINSYLGKMHRLNVDADQNPGSTTIWGYTAPANNPFVGVAGLDEIWHYGLRNPWRSSFDRATGNIYIADVGQNVYEEIDIAPAGVGGINYGWDQREGFACSTVSGCTSSCGTAGFTDPVYAYDHASTGSCSVTGGYVYRGPNIPDLQGTYFFADYCSNLIWTMPAGGGAVTNVTSSLSPSAEAVSISSITSFGEDANGEVYIVAQGGNIFKIRVNCAGASMIVGPQPGSQTVCEGANVSFTVGVSGNRGATTYTWRRNLSAIGAPNSPTLNLTGVGPGDAGNYDCVIQDQCNTVTSNAAVLTVQSPGLGDENADCAVNLLDVPIFVDVLLGLDADPGHIARADMNASTTVDGDDIAPFTHQVAP